MSRVVVTGGLGFLGSHLCPALADAGYQVTAVDDLSGGHTVEPVSPSYSVAVLDAGDVPREGLLDDAGAVIHLAAVPGVRSAVPRGRRTEQNVHLPRDLARAAADRGVRFVLVSTSSVYGNASTLPTPEDAPFAPLNAYARSKVAAEIGCPDALVARLFTVYGPGQRRDMAFAGWIESLGRGLPVGWCAPDGAARDFTFVDDAVRGLIAVLEFGRSGEAYNVGGMGPVPVRAALAELEAIMESPARLQRLSHGVREARTTAACGRKGVTELGYVPRVGLREGLQRQVESSTRSRGSRLRSYSPSRLLMHFEGSPLSARPEHERRVPTQPRVPRGWVTGA